MLLSWQRESQSRERLADLRVSTVRFSRASHIEAKLMNPSFFFALDQCPRNHRRAEGIGNALNDETKATSTGDRREAIEAVRKHYFFFFFLRKLAGILFRGKLDRWSPSRLCSRRYNMTTLPGRWVEVSRMLFKSGYLLSAQIKLSVSGTLIIDREALVWYMEVDNPYCSPGNYLRVHYKTPMRFLVTFEGIK